MAKSNKSNSSSSSKVTITWSTRNTGNSKNWTWTISLSNGKSVSYTTVWWKTSYDYWGRTYWSASSLANAIKTWSTTWSVATPSKWGTYKYNPTTWYYERTDWWYDIYWNTVVWWWKVSNLNSMASNKYGGSYNNNVASSMSNMKFWNAASWTDLNSRNSQIADIMKKNWIKATDATNVKEFLEMYAPGYKEASDEDKNNTANKIFWLYSPASNDDTLNMWENLNGSENSDIDYSEIDWLLNEEWWNNDENLEWEENEQSLEEMLAERDRQWQQKLDDMRYEYENQYLNNLEEWVDSLSNNQTEEKKWLSDAEKEANTAASAAAWNAAQWWNNAEAETTTAEQPATQPVVNSENYWDRQTKIMNILWNLWYNIETAPSEQAENQEVWAVLEWWEQEAWAEEQAAIAESNTTNWEETPTYTDEPSLVTSYQKAFDNLLQQWPSPETAKEAIKTYLQAKDAAALFTVQNNLSDEAYQNILNQIKSVPSLKDLLKNYNK